jgi:glutamate racemase
MNNFPIGIIDSGSGGLSIWKEITALLPNESTVYIGDHAHLPYSEKSTLFIRHRIAKLIQFLLSRHVKLIVIACNTATVAGIDWYRLQFPDIPIIGVVPVIKTAAGLTKTNEICILSTKYTAESDYQKSLITAFASKTKIYSIGSSRLVTYIESAEDTSVNIIKELQTILRTIIHSHVDVLVLGCTHFPFIKEAIRMVIGPAITLLDSGPAVARHVQRILGKNNLFSNTSKATYTFYSTGVLKRVTATYRKLLTYPVVVLKAPIA